MVLVAFGAPSRIFIYANYLVILLEKALCSFMITFFLSAEAPGHKLVAPAELGKSRTLENVPPALTLPFPSPKDQLCYFTVHASYDSKDVTADVNDKK